MKLFSHWKEALYFRLLPVWKTFPAFWFLTRVKPVCNQSPLCGDVPVAHRDYTGFTENYRAAPKGLPLFPFFPSKIQRWLWGKGYLSNKTAPSVSSHKHRTYHESLDGSLSRRSCGAGLWKLQLHIQVIGSGTPATGWRGTTEFIQWRDKGKCLQTGMQEGCSKVQRTALAFMNIPAAKWQNVALCLRV